MRSNLTAIGAVLVALACGLFIYANVATTNRGLQESTPRASVERGGDQGGERVRRGGDPAQMMERWGEELNLTSEQRNQFRELAQRAEDLEGRERWQLMGEAREILTDSQREQLRSSIGGGGGGGARAQAWMQRRDQQAREALSDRDYEVYQERREEMRQRWAERRGNRGGAGEGGGRRGGGN